MKSGTTGDESRLDQALHVYLAWRRDPDRATAEGFLADNVELRDLLAPMLTEAADDAGAIDVLTEPRELGDYCLLREIGRGGMGVVYEATQTSLDRRVALKVLPAHVTLQPEAITRFRREARATAKLQHPGIVEIYEVGRSDDTHFFAMELIDGAPLDQVLDRLAGTDPSALHAGHITQAITGATGSTPAKGGYVHAAIEIIAQVADALHHAHAAGIIHRDVKPSNIMLRRSGEPVLMDFGLAREQDTPSITITGQFAGTPHYVSPEQASLQHERLDRRTDIFSLGTTLYELVSFARPFSGDSPQDVIGRIRTQEPESLTKANPRLPLDLVAIVEKALEKDPNRRYQTAREMAADLRAFLDHRPVSARRVSSVTRILRWTRREPLKAMLLLGAATTIPSIAALAGYAFANQREISAGEAKLLKDRVDALIQRGHLGLFQHDPGALPALRSAVQLDPGNPFGALGLARMALREGDREGALAALELYRSAEGTNPLDRLRVWLLRRLGRATRANELEAAIGEPHTPVDFFVAGIVVLESVDRLTTDPQAGANERTLRFNIGGRGDSRLSYVMTTDPMPFREATRLFRNALLRAPDANLLYHAYLAQAAGGTSMPPGGRTLGGGGGSGAAGANELMVFRAALESAIRSAPDRSGPRWGQRLGTGRDARESARALVTLWPNLAIAHMFASIGLANHDPEEATQLLLRAAQIDNDDVRVHRMLASLRAQMGRDQAAVGALREVIRRAPDDLWAHTQLALALNKRGDAKGEREEHTRWSTLRPDDANALATLARCLLLQGDIKDGRALAMRAATMDVADPYPSHVVGYSYALTDERGKAAAWERKALRIDPRHASAHRNLLINLGKLGDKDGEGEERARWARVRPRDAGARAEWARFLLGRGDIEEGRAEALAAVKLDPKHTYPPLVVGYSYLLANEHAEAACWQRKVLELNPRQVNAHGNLLQSLKKLGDIEGQRAELARWAGLYPSSRDAQSALREFEKRHAPRRDR